MYWLNINNIYNLIFGDWDQGVVLFKYTIQGNEYTFMKRSTKRSIYIQIMLFSMNGIYTLFKDRKQELMIFATGNIYRETGTASREVEDKQYSTKDKIREENLSKKVELQGTQCKQKTSRSPAEVELKVVKRDRKASRNSWADIYNEMTALRKHKMLLGQEVETDDGLGVARQVGSTRGRGIWFACIDIFIAGQYIAALVFGAFMFIFACVLYYKNVSFVIAKRLLRETNVVMILILALCNWSIDIARPANSLSPVNGFFYVLGVSAFVFLDAVKVKSRVFVMVDWDSICICEHQ